MPYYELNPTTTVSIVQKVGSRSMYDALQSLSNPADIERTALQALTYRNRVAFIRHPITRVNSVFNHFYALERNNQNYHTYLPDGIITADGARLKNDLGHNQHHFTERKLDEYNDRIARDSGTGDLDVKVRRLDNKNYRDYIDYVLENGDEHWNKQLERDRYSGRLVSNIWHRFENVNDYWWDYAGGQLPHNYSFKPIDVDEYRLRDLQTHYSEDIAFWEGINGTYTS